ncbi:hypothetical protein DFH29DRAFT_1004830 [Suillus ampliporus]|nr:hypothetical protein DFH29DRAFT_1004830 [Suillus ampliporus]
MAWESDQYAQALLALARSQPSNSPTPISTPNTSFVLPPHTYSGQHVWGDPAYGTMQHQPLAHLTTINSTAGASAWGRDDHNVGLDYYGGHGWSRGAQMSPQPLPSACPEPSTPTPTKGSAKCARAGTTAPKLQSVKKPHGSTIKAMQMNMKADENTPPPDINLEDDGDPVDEVMQTTHWSADKKTILFECSFRKASLIFV